MTDRPPQPAEIAEAHPEPPVDDASVLAHVRALSGESAPALLALYSAIVEELHQRGVVRSTNNPVGDYAEYLVARAFDLSLVGNSSIGYDAISTDGVRYQVKSRRLTLRNRSRQLGFFRGFQLTDDPFDLLVAILFNVDFTVQRAALVPIAIVREHAARVEYVNAWRLILRDSVWAIPGVQDVTERIRAVAGATESADRGEP